MMMIMIRADDFLFLDSHLLKNQFLRKLAGNMLLSANSTECVKALGDAIMK